MPSTTVMINEIATRGPGDALAAPPKPAALDEFVELRNVSASSQPIGGWKLLVVQNLTGATQEVVTIPAGTSLTSGARYLIANSLGYTGTAAPNQTYAAVDIPDDAGVRLVNAAGATIDQVGFQAAAINAATETTPANPQTSATDPFNRSNMRLVCGTGAESVDTDNNGVDFLLRTRTPGTANAC